MKISDLTFEIDHTEKSDSNKWERLLDSATGVLIKETLGENFNIELVGDDPQYLPDLPLSLIQEACIQAIDDLIHRRCPNDNEGEKIITDLIGNRLNPERKKDD